MQLSIIVAIAHNNAIGKDNDIPWYLPADLKYFKKTTLGHPIIMGRKCHESIGRPLPKRTNIVITRNPHYQAEGCIVVHSLDEAIAVASESAVEEIFIIGGGEIYTKGLPLCSKLYVTEVAVNVVDATVFFPKINPAEWKLTKEENHQADEKNDHDYTFKVMVRKNII